MRYTFGVIGELLGCSFACVPANQPVSGEYQLHYQPEPSAGVPWLPWTGWLGETGVRSELRPDAQADLPAAIFYLLSDYEKYQQAHYDPHDRYDQAAYPSAQLGLEEVPLVHHWAEKIRDKLQAAYPALTLQPPKAALHLTVDVDHPWRYRHKGLPVSLGGLGKALVQGQWREATERVKVLSGWQADPNDTFDRLQQLLPPAQTTFFALIDRQSPFDGRHTHRTPALRRLLRELAGAGYHLGIHPSYLTFQDPEQMQREVGYLQDLLGQPIQRSRQHFLRFRYPDTYRALLACGIEEDHTPCLVHQGGFPHGMARAFPWYDLLAEQETTLRLHPTIVMDRSLQQYAQLGPAQALARVRELGQIVQRYGGVFTLLLHNESLSETAEWQGWSEVVQAMVEGLRQQFSLL